MFLTQGGSSVWGYINNMSILNDINLYDKKNSEKSLRDYTSHGNSNQEYEEESYLNINDDFTPFGKRESQVIFQEDNSPQKIDEEFLVELKIEIDSEFGNEDEFEIET